jgi:hypothetical protein
METIDQPIEITDDNPTDKQLDQAFKKACREFGDCVADYESDEFTTEFHDQLNLILNEEAIQNLINKGLMTAVVREDGAIGYTTTPLGRQVAESAGV